ncbi:MAG: polyamine aminopropyltransferase [Kiloniellales bacterium]
MADVFEESLVLDGVGQRMQVSARLYQGHTGLQQVEVLDTPAYGRVLVLDGVVQTSERDEFIYHEMMAHVPLNARALAQGPAKQVLIVGGGDGGTLEEVLKHPVEGVTLVEIDAAVVEIARRYLPSVGGDAFDDSRTRLVIGDGARFVAETDDRFDAILVDSTDPHGPGEALFGEAFYRRCRARLNPGGVLVTQAGIPFTGGEAVRRGLRRLARVFGGPRGYLATIPTYVGGAQLFAWASLGAVEPTPVREALARHMARLGLETRYYSPAVHRAAFVLPPFMADLFDWDAGAVRGDRPLRRRPER